MMIAPAVRALFAAGVIACGVLVAAASEPASRPSVGPTTRKATPRFALSQAIKQPVSKYSLADLARMWSAFKHEPYETAGFNHFVLPFHYQATDGTWDANEANAFSFLLSHSLDWTPGNYCSRHAYFVFKRARKQILKLRMAYDQKLIGDLVKDWSASHAVGGVLRRNKDGHFGDLEIYDRTGKLVLQKKYDKPREYFDLLGDMCVDAMKYFGHQPSPALVAHLHRKRCKDPQSIVDLGRAAFVEEKSDEEFGLYRAILKRDPGFADVRIWSANQMYWVDRDRGEFLRQMALAMESYLVEAGLWDFDPGECPDKKLAGKYKTWLKDAEKLVGRDSTSLLLVRLEQAEETGRVSPELLARATPIAGKYPNNYLLLHALARAYEKVADSHMAASVYIAALRGRHFANTDHLRTTYGYFARCMKSLGHNDIAAQSLTPTYREELLEGCEGLAWTAMMLGKTLDNMGRHAQAVKCYRVAFKGSTEGWRNEMLVRGGIAAALAGRNDIVAQILRDRKKQADQQGLTHLLNAYNHFLTDGPWRKDLGKKPKPLSYYAWYEDLFFRAQMSLIEDEGKDAWARKHVTQLLAKSPNNRRAWILFDGFDRFVPKAESASFYDMIDWLHSEDPWVKQAVADRRRRTDKSVSLSLPQLLTSLKSFEPVRWPKSNPSAEPAALKTVLSIAPGSIATVLRRLIRQRDFDKALELAWRYHHLAVDLEHFVLRAHCNHLIRLIERARERNRRPKATPKPDKDIGGPTEVTTGGHDEKTNGRADRPARGALSL